MTVRLADIAARAGVSVATVSRVLNDKPGVNERTRRVVLTAVDVLGYDRPVRLRKRTSGLVGLVLPELENPFFPRLAQALEERLARHGYTPVLCSQTLGGVHEDDYVRSLLDHGVAGIVFVSGIHAVADTPPARYRRLTEAGLPVVFVNGPMPDVAAPAVSTDDAASMDLAVGHLAHMGHRDVGLVTGQRRYVTVQRKVEGFKAAMRRHVDAGLGEEWLEERIASTYYTVEGGSIAASALLGDGARGSGVRGDGVTGVVCASDVMAIGVVAAARQRGLDVPEQVSVVGCDDSLLTEFTDPPLTTVRQPVPALAEAAVRSLLDVIAGARPATGERVFRPELVVRGSTARVPGP
jgi:alanine racemase